MTDIAPAGLTPAFAPEDAAEVFQRHRETLFSIAYRMVGAVSDAEDLVQDGYLRWQRVDTPVASPGAYLKSVVTRLAIDHLKSARVRHEDYVGPWLPEPLVTPREGNAADAVQLAESLSTAFLLLLERLAPLERAVFLLHDIFDLQYGDVGRIVDREPAACRQIAKRARHRIMAGRPRFDVAPDEAETIAEQFMAACATGEVDAFLPLLSPDVVSWTDSGGLVPGARRPVLGADRCARLWAGIGRKGYRTARIQRVSVNGAPGFVLRAADGPTRVLGFTFSQGLIREIFVFSNPDRLGSLPPEA